MDPRCWFAQGQIEVREGQAGEPWLTGYAAVFNSETIIEGFGDRWRERIAPTAFDSVIGRANVIAAVNHDAKMVLGRNKAGTLKLTIDATGLRYDVKLPNTTLGRDTLENVRNGNYQGSSFKFRVSEDGLQLEKPKRDSDLPLITIHRIDDLFDVGPVTNPAYEDTSVGLRDVMSALRAQHDACAHLLRETAMRERQQARIAIERARAWR